MVGEWLESQSKAFCKSSFVINNKDICSFSCSCRICVRRDTTLLNRITILWKQAWARWLETDCYPEIKNLLLVTIPQLFKFLTKWCRKLLEETFWIDEWFDTLAFPVYLTFSRGNDFKSDQPLHIPSWVSLARNSCFKFKHLQATVYLARWA